jgi:hypothetical protein
MSHYLPVEKIGKELETALDEFQSGLGEAEKEETRLEADMMDALAKQKMEALKKKLSL